MSAIAEKSKTYTEHNAELKAESAELRNKISSQEAKIQLVDKMIKASHASEKKSQHKLYITEM